MLWHASWYTKNYCRWRESKIIEGRHDVVVMDVSDPEHIANFVNGKDVIEVHTTTILVLKNIDARFDGNVGITSKLWLRKEILREFQKMKT